MRRVYKILVIRRKSLRRCRRDISKYKGFWRYFNSLSELAAWVSKINIKEFCFPYLGKELSKEELYILSKKLDSKTCRAMIPESDIRKCFIEFNNPL